MSNTTEPPARRGSEAPGPRRNSRSSTTAHILAVASGLIAVLGIFVLVGVGRLSPHEGLPWIAATLSGLAHLRNGPTSKR